MLRSQNGRVSKEKLQKYPNSDVLKKKKKCVRIKNKASESRGSE